MSICPTAEATYAEALHQALSEEMAHDPSVWVLGEGVTDPKGIFGTTVGLLERYGSRRVVESPVSESAMTGLAVGSALLGGKPVHVHQRVDFALYAMDGLINQAAKWRFMFGGRNTVPMVVRMLIGRGWGQGPQHSQSLESVFAHVPGLKVVMPVTPADAKGLLAGAIADPDPVIVLEHRWLYGVRGPVPVGRYVLAPSCGPRIARAGNQVTVVATSYGVLEALRAAEAAERVGLSVEVVDLRVLRPLDVAPVIDSVRRTGALVTVDTGWTGFGVGSEVVSRVTEQAFGALRHAPVRLGCADQPAPCTRSLIGDFYPRASGILRALGVAVGHPEWTAKVADELSAEETKCAVDQPDPSFRGPF